MTTLTVTARGQVTFRKDMLPDGQGVLKAARPEGAIDGYVGLLAGRTTKVASIEEMNDAQAAAKVLTDRVRGSKKYALDDPLLGLGTSPVGKRASVGFAKMDLRIYSGRYCLFVCQIWL
jgi:hypothetical protein